MNRSWLEISTRRLRTNVDRIRRHVGSNAAILAVVKADAYGLGLLPFSQILDERKVKAFAVATPEEGRALRQYLPAAQILVLNGWAPGETGLFREFCLTAALFDDRPVPADIPVHLKINTGMNRLGIPCQKVRSFLDKAPRKVTGLYSYFASADDDPECTERQLDRFLEATAGWDIPRHICNSAALRFPRAHLDAVRIGLALHGIDPTDELTFLEPIVEWKAPLLAINTVAAGESIGYGGSFTVKRASRIGILPVGYADGFDRRLSNQGQVRIQGRLVSVVGRVSMDLTCVDLTGVDAARVGDTCTLVEADPDSPLSVVSWARRLETIPWEILTSFGPRLLRKYL